MKIVLVSPGYYPRIGGVEYVVKSIAERLARRGHSVIVVAGDPDIKTPWKSGLTMSMYIDGHLVS